MIVETIGYIAMIFLLLGWALIRKFKVTADVISMLGGITMTIYGILLGQLPLTILNTIWTIIGVYNIRNDLKARS